MWAFWLNVTQDSMPFTWKFPQADLPQVSIGTSPNNTGLLNRGHECETQSCVLKLLCLAFNALLELPC